MTVIPTDMYFVLYPYPSTVIILTGQYESDRSGLLNLGHNIGY